MERKTRKKRKRNREDKNKSRWEGTNKGRRKKENTKRVQKIPLWLNCSSPCGGLTASKGGSWWSVVMEEEVEGVRGGFRGKDGERNGSFMLLDIFVVCNTRPGEIWLAWASWSSFNFIASYSKCYIANPNGPNVQNWVARLHSKFEIDPTINESKIVILVE